MTDQTKLDNEGVVTIPLSQFLALHEQEGIIKELDKQLKATPSFCVNSFANYFINWYWMLLKHFVLEGYANRFPLNHTNTTAQSLELRERFLDALEDMGIHCYFNKNDDTILIRKIDTKVYNIVTSKLGDVEFEVYCRSFKTSNAINT